MVVSSTTAPSLAVRLTITATLTTSSCLGTPYEAVSQEGCGQEVLHVALVGPYTANCIFQVIASHKTAYNYDPFSLLVWYVGKEIVCPNLTAPDNGSVEFISRVGEQASYSCAPGLVVVGEGVRLCQANGEWSGDAPLCGVPCQDLEDPANGGVVQNGSDPGSMAYYTCADGFMPSSKEACRTCSIDGVWLGAEITCKNESKSKRRTKIRQSPEAMCTHFPWLTKTLLISQQMLLVVSV